jgi:hypothetical protein
MNASAKLDELLPLLDERLIEIDTYAKAYLENFVFEEQELSDREHRLLQRTLNDLFADTDFLHRVMNYATTMTIIQLLETC